MGTTFLFLIVLVRKWATNPKGATSDLYNQKAGYLGSGEGEIWISGSPSHATAWLRTDLWVLERLKGVIRISNKPSI